MFALAWNFLKDELDEMDATTLSDLKTETATQEKAKQKRRKQQWDTLEDAFISAFAHLLLLSPGEEPLAPDVCHEVSKARVLHYVLFACVCGGGDGSGRWETKLKNARNECRKLYLKMHPDKSKNAAAWTICLNEVGVWSFFLGLFFRPKR